MYRVTIRFYEELNDFLPAAKRKRDIVHTFKGKRSVKDLVESFGVPHVEVDLILVNGRSVDFSYIVSDEDRISVYPEFETLDIQGASRLRPEPLRDTRFVLDVHLGKLARRLRLLGFDSDYEKHRDDDHLARISAEEKRVLLTRDRQLLMRRSVTRGFIVRSTDPAAQVTEVLDRLDLWSRCSPFTRCIECNGIIGRLDPADGGDEYPDAMGLVPPGVRSWCTEYFRCRGCGRIYWRGSHYDKLDRAVREIMEAGKERRDRY